jgi:site-specific recombinase XerD
MVKKMMPLSTNHPINRKVMRSETNVFTYSYPKECVDAFISHYTNSSTQRSYINDIMIFFSYCDYSGMSVKSMKDITEAHIASYRNFLSCCIKNKNQIFQFNGMEVCGSKPSTVQRRLASLSRFFNFAATQGWTEMYLSSHIKFLNLTGSVAQKQLSAKDITVITNWLQQSVFNLRDLRNKIVVSTFLATGCRVADLATMTTNDFVTKTNADGTTSVFCRYMTKNNTMMESLLPEVLFNNIQVFVQETNKAYFGNMQYKCGVIEDQPRYVFTKIKPYTRKALSVADLALTRLDVYQIINSLTHILDLDCKVTPHSLRALFATSLANVSGVDAAAIAGIMGHSSVVTTTHYVAATQAEVSQSLENIFSNKVH